MGHIYQRGDRFWISYRDDKRGKRIRRSAGGTRLEALAELHRIEGVPAGVVPCELLISDYLERCAAYLKSSTLTQYEWSSQRLLDFFAGRDAAALTSRDLTSFIEKRRACGSPDSTINLDFRVLRAVLYYAVECGRLEKLPLKVKQLRTPKHRVPAILSPDEATKLLENAKEPAFGILLIALSTGFRIAEILHLTWNDVHEADGRLAVTSKPGVWTTKTYAERSVFVSQRVIDYLRERRQEAEFSSPKDWVFSTRTAKPLQVRNASRSIRGAFKRAGIYRNGDGLVHRIRHTAASRMLANGVDLRTVQDIMGHSNPLTTARYLHVVDGKKRQASERLGLV